VKNNPFAYLHGEKPKPERPEFVRQEMTPEEAMRIEADIAAQRSARVKAMETHRNVLAAASSPPTPEVEGSCSSKGRSTRRDRSKSQTKRRRQPRQGKKRCGLRIAGARVAPTRKRASRKGGGRRPST
jgi:hypothetical protein